MAQILVIDDEDLICQVADRALRLFGHEVVTASDGKKAVDLLQQHPLDLLITDVRMPGMNGLDVIKALHALQLKTRVIVMGGDGSVPAFGVEAFARQVGADQVLHKPFGARELNAAVSSLLSPAAGG
jgi:DNA-binding response OmpR family regulator